jgi:hypothetical protein
MTSTSRRRHLLPALFLLAAAQFIDARAPDNASAAAPGQKSRYPDPKTTYRNYLQCIRKTDREAAKKCWVIEDDNKSGALDVVVGLWTSMRRLNNLYKEKLGGKGIKAVLKGWHRDDVSDQAIARTLRRLADAEVKISGDAATLKIKWKKDDGYPNDVFCFGDEPIPFRKVKGCWKIDANKMTGLKRAADFFEQGTWGRMFRDQLAIMDEAIAGLEKGKLRSAEELSKLLKARIAAMQKKHEVEREKKSPKTKKR